MFSEKCHFSPQMFLLCSLFPLIRPMPEVPDGDISVDEPERDTDGEDIVCDDLPEVKAQDVFALVNKVLRKGTKDKELDPKKFKERKVFDDADADQWNTHIRTGAVGIIPPDNVKHVDQSRILRQPPRFVRTDKNGKNPDLTDLKAKSQMVLPGHVLPEGEIRTDAPVTPQQSLHVTLSNSANICTGALVLRRQGRVPLSEEEPA